MVQALRTQGGSLPQGLTIQNTYTKLRKGSKKAVVVVQNNTTYPQTLQKKAPVARAVVALPVPEPPRVKNWKKRLVNPITPPLLHWQTKTWQIIWQIGPKWPGLMDPKVGGCCSPAPGQIPWHVFIGSSRVRLCPLHRAYNKSDWWYLF